MSFQTGDVVTLKSGGPNMTVTEIDDTYVTCIWFADRKQAQPSTYPFEPYLLMKASTAPDGIDV